MNKTETITEPKFIPSNDKERSDLFISICRRYTSIKLDYSLAADVKIELQDMMKQEMERLMQPKY